MLVSGSVYPWNYKDYNPVTHLFSAILGGPITPLITIATAHLVLQIGKYYFREPMSQIDFIERNLGRYIPSGLSLRIPYHQSLFPTNRSLNPVISQGPPPEVRVSAKAWQRIFFSRRGKLEAFYGNGKVHQVLKRLKNYTYINTSIYIYTYLNLYVCMYVCIYILFCIYINMYTFPHLPRGAN